MTSSNGLLLEFHLMRVMFIYYYKEKGGNALINSISTKV